MKRFGPLDIALVLTYLAAFVAVVLDMTYWRAG